MARPSPAWTKGITTKGGIDAADIWDTNAELSKKWVSATFRKSPMMLPQLAGLFAKLAHGIAASTLGRVVDLERRISALENNASAIDGRGLKFMGRWNRDVEYQKGDFTSHAGVLWVASRPTTDAPGSCTDWQKMLTADRRGGFNAEAEG